MNKSIATFVQQLAQDPVFASLSPSELEELALQSRLRSYAKGEWIVHNGDIWPYLLWVESGKINALKESGEGRSLITTTILPQEKFWGLAFFQEDLPMPVALVAEEESHIRLWSREQFLPFYSKTGKCLGSLPVKWFPACSKPVKLWKALPFTLFPAAWLISSLIVTAAAEISPLPAT